MKQQPTFFPLKQTASKIDGQLLSKTVSYHYAKRKYRSNWFRTGTFMHVCNARQITWCCKALNPVIGICRVTHIYRQERKTATEGEKKIWKVAT